ncbi:MAG TPA: PilZ domain-containing protein [Candidatus Baltobacteraceae bacterium]|nr:PilZ domain-containing protein [Candidatus Baltobacteraceae bacterium]
MSTQENHSHERRFFRANADFPVTLIVPGHELILTGTALDLSGGGMRVATSTDLPAGQPIMLRFVLPDGERELLVRARIVLSFYDAAAKSFAHGIAFTQYTTQDHDEISAWTAKSQSAQA